MIAQLIIRFLLGGTIVSAFALIGGSLKPKTFGGIFGAAPSVALASLGLAFGDKGAGYVAAEAIPMAIGALAFVAYGAACVLAAKKHGLPVWLGAAGSWVVWFAVGAALFFVAHTAGVLR